MPLGGIGLAAMVSPSGVGLRMQTMEQAYAVVADHPPRSRYVF